MKLIYFSLILTAISLLIGSIMLLNLVPRILTIGTLAIVAFLIISLFTINKYAVLKYILLILAILAIIISSSSKAHIQAFREFGQSLYITTLDILMILGFYVGPILYIVALFRDNLKK
ncbi:hypothetical protein GFS03_11570 [Sulfolobus sp. E5-1-F]|uniref:hypothetical protein n=1 Tax=Saccharolobus sp. E5-1-F TaxID=2663019 RepID=UPI001296F86B|nr:hypothetical protein [Sulfolobus sp. E5-1-F]QGA55165.1 hypothetical protein GFS03_11570 [Sulfolobus sp. E5-1-F]